MLNSLDLDQAESFFDLIWIQTVCKAADDRSQISISYEYEGAWHWVTLYVEVMF